jgi:fumarylacetoacetase
MPDALSYAGCSTAPSITKSDLVLPPHLQHQKNSSKANIDLALEVVLVEGKGTAKPGSRTVICKSNLRHLYWSPGQMVAHHASSGCGLQAGDLMGTGTISGRADKQAEGENSPTPSSLGCLFEMTQGGKQSVPLSSGRDLIWLEDGDEIVFTGWAKGGNGKRIGFGECRAAIMG